MGIWRAKPRIPRAGLTPAKPDVRQLDRALTALRQRIDSIESILLQLVKRGRA